MSIASGTNISTKDHSLPGEVGTTDTGDIEISLLPRPFMKKMVKKTSKRLRAKLRAKQENTKTPIVKKTINKKTGKIPVSFS